MKVLTAKEEEDPFMRYEAAMSAELASLFRSFMDTHRERIMDALDQLPSTFALELLIDELGGLTYDVVREGDRKPIRDESENAIMAGAALSGLTGVTIASLASGRKIRNALTDEVQYYANSYFERIAGPALQGQMERALSLTGLSTQEMRDLVAAGWIDLLDTDKAYWTGLANHTTSKSLNYGILEAGKRGGYKGYRIIATLDDRTTALCRSLHGKTFWIEDALSYFDEYAATEPEARKEKFPYYFDAKSRADDLSDDELVSQQILVPPFHHNCRSILEVVL